MSSSAHRSFLTATIVGIVLTTNALPWVVHSQVMEEGTRGQADETSSLAVVGEATPVLAELENPYPTDELTDPGSLGGDFVVGPGKVELTLKPGESKIVELLVSNRTGVRRQFNLSTEDAAGSQDPAVPVVLLGSDRGPYSLKDYLSVPHKKFVLGNNERARIPVTVSVPPDAEPGGLYGSMVVDTVSISTGDGDGGAAAPKSSLVTRVGTLFFITVPGDAERSGSLKRFGTIGDKTFYTSGPINFGILFENTGATHLLPSGELTVSNFSGETVGEVTLEPWYVMPSSVRLREVSWERGFLMGRYTATLTLKNGYNDTLTEASVTFWVLPWKPITGGLAVIFIVFFLIHTFFKTFEFKRKVQ